MTVSAEQRAKDFRTALERITALVGDHDVREIEFGPDHAAFADLLSTTFAELLRQSLVDYYDRTTGRIYRMNHNGWARAVIQLLRLENEPEFARRKGAFCRAVKTLIDGRLGDPRQISVAEFAAVADLPVGWCWNAIRGNLFCQVKDASRYGQLRYTDTDVILPTTWGQEPLRF